MNGPNKFLYKQYNHTKDNTAKYEDEIFFGNIIYIGKNTSLVTFQVNFIGLKYPKTKAPQ